MAGFTESGITLDFPTKSWFRFEKSRPYNQLSAYNFKEMDACWLKLDAGGNIFYAIELKDYSCTLTDHEKNVLSRVHNIVKKAVDTLQMIQAARCQTSFGQSLEIEKSVDLHTTNPKLIFMTIVVESTENVQLLQILKDQCRNLFRPYAMVWGNMEFHVLTYEHAKKYFTEFVK